MEAEDWVAVAFFILLGVFAYFGIHRTVLRTLDHRRDRIRNELDDARKLKDEAAKLLAEYRARRESAVREAEEIIASARAEAERTATEAKTRMEEFVARRTKMAESKIAQAEAQALRRRSLRRGGRGRGRSFENPRRHAEGVGSRCADQSGHRRGSAKAELTDIAGAKKSRPRYVAGSFLLAACSPKLTFLSLPRGPLGLHAVRVKADIEHIRVGHAGRRYRVAEILGHEREWHIGILTEVDRCVVQFGGNRLRLTRLPVPARCEWADRPRRVRLPGRRSRDPRRRSVH